MKKLIWPLAALMLLVGVSSAQAQTTAAWLDCSRTKANDPYVAESDILPDVMVGTAVINCARRGNAPDLDQMDVTVRLDKICLMRRRTTGASRPWTAKRGCNRSTRFVDMRLIRPLGIFYKGFEIERTVLNANREWYWQTWVRITVKAKYRGQTQTIPRNLWVSEIERYKKK
jgi:hypothetical protein